MDASPAPRRSDTRMRRSEELLPRVEAYVTRHGFNELDRRAREAGFRWYKTPSNALAGYNRWLKGEAVPEFWVMDGYQTVVNGTQPLGVTQAPDDDDTLAQVEMALSCTDLPRSKQFEILAIVAKGLES